MQPCRSKLLMMLALGTVCLRLSAQQSIIVSQPADAGNSGKADKSSHKNSHSSLLDYFSQETDSNRDINAGDFNAPQSFFHDNNSASFPLPHPIYFSRQSIEAANKDKNWTLLTPAEILGVQTPEEILGINNNKDQNLSLDEQFLQRLQNRSAAGATNGGPAGLNWGNNNNNDPFQNSGSSGWENASGNNNPFRRLNSTDDSALSSGRMGSFQSPNPSSSDLSRLFNQPNASSSGQQGQGSIWTSPFARPSQPQTQTSQEQLDAMARFRALMQPGSQSSKTVMPVRYSSPSKSESAPASFFNTQPSYNPAGGSADQVLDNASRPAGLQAIPGVGAPRLKTETTRPAWQAQLPPWMRKGPPQHNH